MNAKAIMIQGTSSDSGKSTIAMALCRIFSDLGYKVAPFKSQNMSLNSYINEEGEEIARSQVMQAWAARTEPIAENNPVLLKPKGNMESQIILMGKPYKDYNVRDYYAKFIPELKVHIKKSLDFLLKNNDILVIEGAGSPAEINLSEIEIANMYIAKLIECPVILTADIERGGVFASIYGTIELLTAKEKNLIKGFIINKFRGLQDILDPGIQLLEEKLGKKCLGVVPYVNNLRIPAEDSLNLNQKITGGILNVKVIRLPRLSNFTDYEPLLWEKYINLEYVTTPDVLDLADLVIIPGTKNTVEDLEWLKNRGFPAKLYELNGKGVIIVGICGGFQMLGEKIFDNAIEGKKKETYKGLGLLKVKTIFSDYEKVTRRVKGNVVNFPPLNGLEVEGYEIHMGKIFSIENHIPFMNITKVKGKFEIKSERECISAANPQCNVVGTFLHGFWDNDKFRTEFMKFVAKNMNKKLNLGDFNNYRDTIEDNITKIAKIVSDTVDISSIKKIMKL